MLWSGNSGKAKLSFEFRSGADREELHRSKWRGLQSDTFLLQPQDRFLQYRATFHSDNGDRYPILNRVEITLKR